MKNIACLLCCFAFLLGVVQGLSLTTREPEQELTSSVQEEFFQADPCDFALSHPELWPLLTKATQIIFIGRDDKRANLWNPKEFQWEFWWELLWDIVFDGLSEDEIKELCKCLCSIMPCPPSCPGDYLPPWGPNSHD
ncbi:hypothetical protein CAPTEDRAFT_215679 [Capitella teleta]|uniref:Uncharacterized protein n=1 Tax=Capitella teleta TaxID=283909 RepID=R7U046_CAPTE|nr:hypothetical protein CAPTEDRAFT_215679 [Capitella teleta]|eukprot:ELT97036.1 hypothetical protein CAPTEDRAFT_215679 [Capitella teleta]